MLRHPRLKTLLLALTLGLSANLASAAEPFKVCWSIYVGWMPWGYGAEQKIVDKWAKKYGIEIDVVQINDYVESINQYTAGQFDGCVMTNMDALTIPAAGGVDSTALIVGFGAPRLMESFGRAKSQAAEVAMANLKGAVQLFYIDTGRYPTEGEGLAALLTAPEGVTNWKGPYLDGETDLADPWGNPFTYTNPGASGPFGLDGFEIVESSEAGMLAEVAKKTEAGEPIIFLGWEPHPMNANFKMTYLTGGDDYFGPNLGGAVVDTNVRAGYVAECPNTGKLLSNLSFTLAMENEIMGAILNDGADPRDAAKTWLAANAGTWEPWLDGVTTKDGGDAKAAVAAALQ